MKFYILNNREPMPIADKSLWEMWMLYHEATCSVHETCLNGEIIISTYFLGCCEEDDPLLFETIIMGGMYDHYSSKSPHWKAAKNEHKLAVGIVLAALN